VEVAVSLRNKQLCMPLLAAPCALQQAQYVSLAAGQLLGASAEGTAAAAACASTVFQTL
jgi:hypothetical protein